MSKLRSAWVALALLIAAVSCAQGFRNALNGSQDFQWSPTRALLSGSDPYAIWLSGDPTQQIILTQVPNYAHLLYLLLVPFALLPWTTAKVSWAIFNIACGIATALLLARRAGLSKSATVLVLCVFLASTPFRTAVGNGQQALLVMFCLYMGSTVRSRTAASFLLATGFTKYTFTLPMAIWLALRRRLTALLGAAALLCAAWLIFSFLVSRSALATAFEPLYVGSKAVGFGIADAMTLVSQLHIGTLSRAVAGVGGAACALGLMAAFRSRLAVAGKVEQFASVSLMSLMSLVHLSYDFVFLLPSLVAIPSLPGARRFLVGVGIVYFWFALKAIDLLWAPEANIAWTLGAWATCYLMLFGLLGPRVKIVSSQRVPVRAVEVA